MAFTEDQLRKELSDLDITSRVKKIGEFSNAFGGYSDVWKCNYGADLVAVKVIRLGDRDKARSLKVCACVIYSVCACSTSIRKSDMKYKTGGD